MGLTASQWMIYEDLFSRGFFNYYRISYNPSLSLSPAQSHYLISVCLLNLQVYREQIWFHMRFWSGAVEDYDALVNQDGVEELFGSLFVFEAELVHLFWVQDLRIAGQSPKRLIFYLIFHTKLSQFQIVATLLIKPVLEDTRFDLHFIVKFHKKCIIVAIRETQVMHFARMNKRFKSRPDLQRLLQCGHRGVEDQTVQIRCL